MGRPPIGPVVKVRIPDPVIEKVDEARGYDTSRAEWIRGAVDDKLKKASRAGSRLSVVQNDEF